MGFESDIVALSSRINDLKDKVESEEATKTSFILPMLRALGYDIFDPTVVVPEFTADIGRKKGEKVDYAIMFDNSPLILIEAKPANAKLDRHKTQLERYFTVTDSRFAILTNGIEYRFYSDLDKPNVMDESPFLVINMLDLKKRDISQLEKFSNDTIDIDKILSMADAKKYINGVKEIFSVETKDPSDELARFFASKLTSKTLRQNVLDEFKGYIKQAFSEVITDMVNAKINSIKTKLAEDSQENENEDETMTKDSEIVTTDEELEGYYIVKSILAEVVDTGRVAQRDTKSYFGVLLDDNNRKWICRLRFNSSNKWLGIHVSDKEEEKFLLESIEDIYKYKGLIVDAANRILSE